MATSVRGIEVLGLIPCIVAYTKREPILYCRKTLAFKLFSRLLPGRVVKNCHFLSYGDLKHVTDIRRTAYHRAEFIIEKLNFKRWKLRPLKTLGAANDLIVEKMLMQELFEKYEFYGLVAQFSRENPNIKLKVFVDPLLFDKGVFSDYPAILVRRQILFHSALYRLSPILIALYVLHFNFRHAAAVERKFEDAVLGEIDSVVVLEMFQDLLQGIENVHYLAKNTYLAQLAERPVELTVHAMNAENRAMLRAIGWSLVRNSLFPPKELAPHGLVLFNLLRMFAHGILVTPSAKRSAYLTFEHLSVEKAVRNEILRAQGNRSVFVPYNIYTSSPYYVPEYKLNYDVLCSPGELCERSYKMQQATTSTVLRTGSYHANKKVSALGSDESRTSSLRAFVGDSLCLTILCNGIDDVTRSGEERLIDLAVRLAEHPGIKIVVRQKPSAPAERFRNFYTDRVGGHPNVMLTHKEFDLYDFLDITDLFITSNSSSILEFCAAEKPMFAVDFWKRTDLFNWQTTVPGIFIQEEEATSTILEWCRSATFRADHALRVKELAALVSHSFPDFAAYKRNFRDLLGPLLPGDAITGFAVESNLLT